MFNGTYKDLNEYCTIEVATPQGTKLPGQPSQPVRWVVAQALAVRARKSLLNVEEAVPGVIATHRVLLPVNTVIKAKTYRLVFGGVVLLVEHVDMAPRGNNKHHIKCLCSEVQVA